MTRLVAIVDYGMGNLFSVLNACQATGIAAEITSDPGRIEGASGVILPGVGAFGKAMEEIERRGLSQSLKAVARRGNPFMGICLGMQLMMEESFEFGRHEGFGFIRGAVVPLKDPIADDGSPLKVPEVGWNSLRLPRGRDDAWAGTLLDGLHDNVFMYFVHSFVCRPDDAAVVTSESQYGQVQFCSTLSLGNLFGCQYHPERSGQAGLSIYRNFAKAIER